MSNMRIKCKRLSAENVKLKAALGMTVDAMLSKCEKKQRAGSRKRSASR